MGIGAEFNSEGNDNFSDDEIVGDSLQYGAEMGEEVAESYDIYGLEDN